MSRHDDLVITPLEKHHDRPGFQCGNDSLDRYIRRQARQDVRRRISRVFVATEPAHPNTIVGYYTLSTLSIELTELPNDIARKLPGHPIPAALVGRLAVSRVAQGHGVGRMLLVDGIKRILAVSDEIAIHAIVVEAVDDRAQRFYEQFGFAPLDSENRRLFLPLRSV